MPTAFTGDSFRNCALEISADGATWTDLAGQANRVQVGGGERPVGEGFAFNKETPSVTIGKRAHLEITVNVLYTEDAAHAYKVLKALYESGARCYFRFAPLSGGTGEDWYTCDPDCVVAQMQWPGGEAQAGDPIASEFVLATESLTMSQKTS
jgi:hypothetical protein